MIKLESKRLLIRDHIEDDLHDYHSLISDNDTLKYMLDVGTSTFNESKESLSDAISQASSEKRERYFFGIFDKLSGAYIGEVGFTILERSPFGDKAEIGYFIKKDFWGRGIAYEAAKMVLDFAFEELGLHKMISGCIADNIGSEKIIQKLGFIKEAHLYKHVYILNTWMDRVEYGLINKQSN